MTPNHSTLPQTSLVNEPDGLALRRLHGGLFGIDPTPPVTNPDLLSVVYTPGVARPCLEIQKDPLISFDYTMRGNTIAIVSDGSSVYGLGNAGAEAVIPILESKSVLHKTFGGIDAVPIAIRAESTEAILEHIRLLEPTFGGFQLEGFSSPRCYELEERLQRALSVPVMHGDKSTAVVVGAALVNSLKLVKKRLDEARIVIYGAGHSGIATARLLYAMGARHLVMCDEEGIVYADRPVAMNWAKAEIAHQMNPRNERGTLADALQGADVYIGYKDESILDVTLIHTMANNPILFALALPQPEITYPEAKAAGAVVVSTQFSEYPNVCRTAMAYPGIFRGALDVRATSITQGMLVAASYALAGMVTDEELAEENILPQALMDPIAATVARAVAQSAIESGIARVHKSPQFIEKRVEKFLTEGKAAWVKPEDTNAPKNDAGDRAMELRRRYQGAIQTTTHVRMTNLATYNALYSKGNLVKACREIVNNPEMLYDLTCKGNLVAVITDGSAVLGLGNIGAGSGLPVMEGKAVLFKSFGAVEAFPVCLNTQDTDEIIATVKAISPIFGGVNLEDIAAPRCFEIEERLIEETDIPIFHDDQHGTAVVCVAAILNALKAVEKPIDQIRIVVNGAGASALSVSRLLLLAGVKDMIICDTKGAIYQGRTVGMNPFKHRIAKLTNKDKFEGQLVDAIRGADVFIGLSVPGALSQDMVRSMAPNAIVLAMANPVPEILPDEALAAGAKIVGTGRSDFPNQVNNCLAFPGIFRGALDVRASRINDEMKLAAARAIASCVGEDLIRQGTVIPSVFHPQVHMRVAAAVAKAAHETQVARREFSPEQSASRLATFFKTGEWLAMQ